MLQNLTKEVRFRTRAALMLPSIRAIGLAIAVGIAYFVAAQLSLALLAEPDGVAVFWPAAGVSPGILIALGRAARLPVVSGVMVATSSRPSWFRSCCVIGACLRSLTTSGHRSRSVGRPAISATRNRSELSLSHT